MGFTETNLNLRNLLEKRCYEILERRTEMIAEYNGGKDARYAKKVGDTRRKIGLAPPDQDAPVEIKKKRRKRITYKEVDAGYAVLYEEITTRLIRIEHALARVGIPPPPTILLVIVALIKVLTL